MRVCRFCHEREELWRSNFQSFERQVVAASDELFLRHKIQCTPRQLRIRHPTTQDRCWVLEKTQKLTRFEL